MNALIQMRMFDTVMNYAFMVQKPKKIDGISIPQDEFRKFEEARLFALNCHRLGILEIFYKRIMEGKV